MALYSFAAKDATGKKYTGEVEVIDEKSLVVTLQKQGLIPIEIKQKNAVAIGTVPSCQSSQAILVPPTS